MNRKAPTTRLIGREVRVEESTNRYLEETRGIVVDETTNTLTIETSDGRKVVPKDVCKFTIVGEENQTISGESLVSQPERRLSGK